jgi:hypothetical protein
MLTKILIPLLFLIPGFSGAQIVQRIEKILIADSCIYLYYSNEDSNNLFKLIHYSKHSADTIFRYTLPIGSFEENAICWDVIDKKLIKLSLFTDNQNKANSHLRYYEIDSLKSLAQKNAKLFGSYLNNRSRSLSAYIPPFDRYNDLIYYRSDTLRGNLYLDFTCSKDSFLFYIYIDGQKSLEKWHYTPFPKLLGFKGMDVKTRQKSWLQLNKINIDLSGPFRTFAANNKNYLITVDGRIMLIAEDSIKEKGKIHDLEQKVLVFDKDRNKLLTIEKGLLKSLKEPLSTENIYQHSKVVIDFDK